MNIFSTTGSLSSSAWKYRGEWLPYSWPRDDHTEEDTTPDHIKPAECPRWMALPEPRADVIAAMSIGEALPADASYTDELAAHRHLGLCDYRMGRNRQSKTQQPEKPQGIYKMSMTEMIHFLKTSIGERDQAAKVLPQVPRIVELLTKAAKNAPRAVVVEPMKDTPGMSRLGSELARTQQTIVEMATAHELAWNEMKRQRDAALEQLKQLKNQVLTIGQDL